MPIEPNEVLCCPVTGNSADVSKMEYVPVGSFRISKRSDANLVSPGAVNATARLKLQQVMLFLSQWNVYASGIAGRAYVMWRDAQNRLEADV